MNTVGTERSLTVPFAVTQVHTCKQTRQPSGNVSVESVTGFAAAASQATGVSPRWVGGDRRPPPSLETPTPLASPQSKRNQLVVQKKKQTPHKFQHCTQGRGHDRWACGPGARPLSCLPGADRRVAAPDWSHFQDRALWQDTACDRFTREPEQPRPLGSLQRLQKATKMIHSSS